MTVFAHAGHWLVSLVYAAPVVVLIVYIGIDRLRNPETDEDEDGEAPPTP